MVLYTMKNLSSTQTSSEPSAKQDLVIIFSKDPDTRFVFKILLGLLGYSCLEAGNMTECVQTLDGSDPGLILMDIHFPVEDDISSISNSDGMAHFGEVPVVLISSYPNSNFRDLEKSFNICDHLVKPVSFTLLESCLKRHIQDGAAQSF
jgi:CheY-like chemotaxis protein